MPLDREVRSSYNLTIQGRDDLLSSVSNVYVRILDVNDNRPHFERPIYRLSVQENTPIGSQVGQVTASDLDSLENAELTYLVDDVTSYFSVEPGTGKILVARFEIVYVEIFLKRMIMISVIANVEILLVVFVNDTNIQFI